MVDVETDDAGTGMQGAGYSGEGDFRGRHKPAAIPRVVNIISARNKTSNSLGVCAIFQPCDEASHPKCYLFIKTRGLRPRFCVCQNNQKSPNPNKG